MSRKGRFLIAAAAALLAACASDHKKADAPQVTTGQRVDMARKGLGDAAVAPLKDLGLVRPEPPRLLADIQYPYDIARLKEGCPQVLYDIGALDAVLGPEDYRPGPERSAGDKTLDAAGGAMQSAAEDATTGFIPFRSWVRRASGATKAERDMAHAIEMGQTRRAFLRGYGLALGCPNVLPPAPTNAPPGERAKDVTGVGAPP